MSEGKETLNVVRACRGTASGLEKLKLLRTLEGNLFAREFFRLVYEPRVNFFLKKVEVPKSSASLLEVFDLDRMKSFSDTLSKRVLTGNAARDFVERILERSSDDDREILKMLIDRDCKAGFSASTLNKVFPGLITDVPYMRCSLPKDSKLKEFPWEEGVFSQVKADGMFANVTHRGDGSVTVESRAGSPFPVDQFSGLVEEVQARIPRGSQLHGEFLIVDAGRILPRQVGNGVLNSVLKGGDLPAGNVPIFEVWDMIPETAAVPKGKWNTPYVQRFSAVQNHIVTGSSSPTHLKVIETRIVNSLREAYDHYRDTLQRGLEGTIVKDPRMAWEDTTSKRQVKLKLEFECDLKVVGFNPGRNKNEKTFGSLQCETSDGLLQVGVSGFTDQERQDVWNDRERILGKVVAVKSNSVMPPSGGRKWHSLFLPVFVEIREDKEVADDLQRVLDQHDATIESVGR